MLARQDSGCFLLMTTVVISQPFLFPWVGLFEQIRLADVFVHYDDVDFSKGSFVNRVQIKTARGPQWLSVPLAGKHLGDKILDLQSDDSSHWRQRHLDDLARYYAQAPYLGEMLQLATSIYRGDQGKLVELLIDALMAVKAYFSIGESTQFYRSSQIPVRGRSSQRVLDVVRHFGGDVYVTGHGAKNYLDHEAFEAAGVTVRYMEYERRAYPQLHGSFDPHVSILDLIANCGQAGRNVIASSTIDWRAFLARQRLAG
jgi:hypothetical protein